MRASREEKAHSRERIVIEAAWLAREHGLDGVGVAEVMQAAGMTHGGFYRHFDSKEALLAAALEAAFDQIIAPFEERGEQDDGEAAVAGFRRHYVSREHVGHPGVGCPIPSLAGDAARAPQAVRTVFSQGVERMVAAVASGLKGSLRQRRAKAARQLAMMAGAVLIARACDEKTSELILASCR